MARRTIRLGSTISFNEETEADIISKIEYLTGRHALGDFISDLLRVALDSPEKLDSRKQLDNVLSEINTSGMATDRLQFFRDISRQIEDMKSKVDKMYDMNLKLMCLAECGKHMGLEDKTKNSLRAQFVLEQQLEELTGTLGISHTNHIFNSNKLLETETKSKEILKYILETYDGVMTELKEEIFKEVELKLNNIQVTGVPVMAVPGAVDEQAVGEDVAEEEVQEDDEPVDFGNADMSLLNNFFGNN